MENKKALKLIDKIVADLNHAGIILNTLVEDLKELREFAREQQNPLVVKVLRLTYEHIEEEESFLISIPEDEPIEEDEEEGVAAVESSHDPIESLVYLISLMKDLDNKMNIADLKEYRDGLKEF